MPTIDGRYRINPADAERALQNLAAGAPLSNVLFGKADSFFTTLCNYAADCIGEVARLQDALSRSEAALEGTTLRYEEMKESHRELVREKIPAMLREMGCLQRERDTHTEPVPIEQWSEEDGAVLWWRFPVEEPPYCGSPLDTDWPGYHTHWTKLIMPAWPGKGAANNESPPDTL